MYATGSNIKIKIPANNKYLKIKLCSFLCLKINKTDNGINNIIPSYLTRENNATTINDKIITL